RRTIGVSPSAPSVLNASVSDRMTLSSIALRTCGRLIATVAMPRASLATITEGSLIPGASAIAGSQRMELSRLHYLSQLANRHGTALKLVLSGNPHSDARSPPRPPPLPPPPRRPFPKFPQPHRPPTLP